MRPRYGAAYARRVPSAFQIGLSKVKSPTGGAPISLRRPLPSGLMTKIPSPPLLPSLESILTNAINPVGPQAGSATKLSLKATMRRRCEPFLATVMIEVSEGTLRSNTSDRPFGDQLAPPSTQLSPSFGGRVSRLSFFPSASIVQMLPKQIAWHRVALGV